jgi:hypothetical protein
MLAVLERTSDRTSAGGSVSDCHACPAAAEDLSAVVTLFFWPFDDGDRLKGGSFVALLAEHVQRRVSTMSVFC